MKEAQKKENPPVPIIREYTFEQLREEPGKLGNLIAVYRRIFGSDPWNEWKRCKSCNRKFGIEEFERYEADSTIHCCDQEAIVDFHPPVVVAFRLGRELTIAGSAPFFFAAEDERQAGPEEGPIVGFIWGYGAPLEDVIANVTSELGISFHMDVPAGAQSVITEKVKERLSLHNLEPNV